jgi:hypothetical protein
MKSIIQAIWQNLMLLVLIIVGSLLPMPTALANSPVSEITVSLGNSSGELKFFPSNLQFQTGKEYKLRLDVRLV